MAEIIEETKKKVIEFLKKEGLTDAQIHFPSEDDMAKAPIQVREFLKNMIIVPYRYILKDLGNQEVVFSVKIIVSEKWINIKLLLFDGKLPDAIRLDLYDKLLKANFIMNEVTYSVSDFNEIYVEADMPVGTTYENFKSEYDSVLYGTDYFVFDVLPKLQEKLTIQTTYKPDVPNFFI